MDGLPLTEQGTHDHASRNPGAMHACGHDGHMAMVLDDGLLDRFPVDALFGLHNLPGVPVGHLHTRSGAIMASEDNVEIASPVGAGTPPGRRWWSTPSSPAPKSSWPCRPSWPGTSIPRSRL